MKQKLKNILLVDDDPAAHFLHTRVIKRLECADNIATVDNGIEAIAFLKAHAVNGHPAPELILLDINMPLMNAWEFLKAYNLLPAQQRMQTVIIMVTTSINPDDELRAKNMPDVNGFHLKPLDKEGMLQILQTHFPHWL